MSAREVVGRLGAALLTEEATEDDAARVLVALGGPVPAPPDASATPDADLAPTGVWVDPDELARADSVAQPLAGHEEGADGAGSAPAAATADETDLERDEAAAEAAVLHAEARRYPEPEPGSGRRRRRPGADPRLPRTGSTSSSASATSAATGGYGIVGGPRATAVPPDPEELAARLVGATEAVERAVQQLAADRPVVAVLLVSTGEVVGVRGDVVVGRAPQPLPGLPMQRTAATRLVAVPSPTHMVSRSHLAVTTAGANLLAQDLGSSNGTVLVRDGISPVLLATALPTPLLVGDLLDVGDGVTLRVAPPR